MYILIPLRIVTIGLALASIITLLKASDILFNKLPHLVSILNWDLLQNLGGVFIIYLKDYSLTSLISLISFFQACRHVDLAAFHIIYFNFFPRNLFLKLLYIWLTQNLCSLLGKSSSISDKRPYQETQQKSLIKHQE